MLYFPKFKAGFLNTASVARRAGIGDFFYLGGFRMKRRRRTTKGHENTGGGFGSSDPLGIRSLENPEEYTDPTAEADIAALELSLTPLYAGLTPVVKKHSRDRWRLQ